MAKRKLTKKQIIQATLLIRDIHQIIIAYHDNDREKFETAIESIKEDLDYVNP